MATVTGLTAARMLEIEKASVVAGFVDSSGNLVLVNHNGDQINAGMVEGPQGVPGPAGEDGTPRYTWLKYADTPVSGMSDDPSGKSYIGLAYNKLSSIESTQYSDYSWTLTRGADGDQGVPGPPGEDGQPTYTWIKYAISQTGAGMSDDPTGKLYIGIAYNKLTQAESSNPADYNWALIKGDTGPVGPPGPSGEDGVSVSSTMFYYKVTAASAAAPAKPTTYPPDGTWSATEPEYAVNTALWYVYLVRYSDGTFVYSSVSKSSSYKAATTAMDTANGKNRVTYSISDAGGSGTTAGDLWFKISGTLIIGMWIWNGSIWQARALDNATIANLDAGKIVTGLLDAMRIGANTITVGKLMVGDFTNLLPNAQWLNDFAGWIKPSSGLSMSVESGIRKARIANVAGTRQVLSVEDYISVQPGETYYLSVRIERVGTFTAGVAGVLMYSLNPTSLVEEEWQEVISITSAVTGDYSVQFSVPSDGTVQRIRPGFFLSETATGGTAVKFLNAQWRRMASGELIVDGSVTAAKLNAAEIWAAQAWIDVLKTRVITADMVSNDFGAKISLDSNGSVTILTGAVSQAQDTADAASSLASSANTKANSAQSTVNSLGLFYRYTSTEAIIGKSGNPTELRLKNDEIGIYQSGTKVSWWNAGQFNVTSMIVDEAKIGNHKIEAYGTDRTIFRKV